MNNNYIQRLSVLLDKVHTDSIQQDILLKSAKLPKHQLKPLFSNSLFPIQSYLFSPYCDYMKTQLAHLEKVLAGANQDISASAIEHFEHQLSSIINALNAASTLEKERQFQRKKGQAFYKKVVEQVTHSSHELYLKLNETKDFERRLEDMLQQAQAQLGMAGTNENQDIQAKVLALHQRLGRCRKAISQLEYEIERAEKLNR